MIGTEYKAVSWALRRISYTKITGNGAILSLNLTGSRVESAATRVSP